MNNPSFFSSIWGRLRSQKPKAPKNEPQNWGVKNLWYIHHTQFLALDLIFGGSTCGPKAVFGNHCIML